MWSSSVPRNHKPSLHIFQFRGMLERQLITMVRDDRFGISEKKEELTLFFHVILSFYEVLDSFGCKLFFDWAVYGIQDVFD